MKRKVLALLLATTMVLGSSMPVLAATGTGENTTGETITGNGDVSYVDTTVYSVTIPTTASMELVVDPQGLTGLTGTATAEELASYAGKITCATIPLVTNLSSVPAKVSVALTLTGDATGVTAVDNVNDDTTKAENVLLYAVPSNVDTEGSADNYAASTTGIVLSTTNTTVNFVLPAASYNFVKDESTGNVTYELVAGETGHGTGLAFEGYVNKHADWSAYAGDSADKTIGMTAVFTFTHTLSDTDVAGTTAYSMMDYAGTTVTVTPPAPVDVAPSIEDVTYTTGSGDLVIPFSLGSGTLAADEVTDIALQFGNTYYSVNGLWNYDDSFANLFTIDNSAETITISNDWMQNCTAGSYELYVIYDDNTALDDTATYDVITITVQ